MEALHPTRATPVIAYSPLRNIRCSLLALVTVGYESGLFGEKYWHTDGRTHHRPAATVVPWCYSHKRRAALCTLVAIKQIYYK